MRVAILILAAVVSGGLVGVALYFIGSAIALAFFAALPLIVAGAIVWLTIREQTGRPPGFGPGAGFLLKSWRPATILSYPGRRRPRPERTPRANLS